MDLERKVKELEEKLAIYENSPYQEAYTGLYVTVKRWSTELKNKAFLISDVEESDIKAFDKAHKVSLSLKDLFEQLDFIRSKMTPIQEADSRKEATSIFEKALQESGNLDANN